ncbi:uncharacterized protein LOC129716230 [Leucoraja erinacea]|uniref:uncharacterized protein LOC129716230 n=1 Tax=Leucoraja erinaceus TaxID=7782 RepID=UPI002453DEAE|nr:uncharacterized protein LOC129716230 [Leucoraja erinacea]
MFLSLSLSLCRSRHLPFLWPKHLLHNLPAAPWTMAVAHKAGDGPRFTVRPFRAGDTPEARRIFSEGVMDQPWPAFRRVLQSPAAACLILTAGAAVCGTGWSLTWTALPVAALLALLYLACRLVYAGFVKQTLEADMADIEGIYMGRPGSGFWVVEEEGGDGGLRGVVAAQKAEGAAGLLPAPPPLGGPEMPGSGPGLQTDPPGAGVRPGQRLPGVCPVHLHRPAARHPALSSPGLSADQGRRSYARTGPAILGHQHLCVRAEAGPSGRRQFLPRGPSDRERGASIDQTSRLGTQSHFVGVGSHVNKQNVLTRYSL